MHLQRIFSIFTPLFIVSCASTPLEKRDYSGRYVTSDSSSDAVLDLTVKQSGTSAALDYMSVFKNGGAAPDGKGTGTISPAGALTFSFEDSYGNTGTGTLKQIGDTYHLSFATKKIKDVRSVVLYRDTVLKKE